MGKRSNFERNERDFYPTPEEAVIPLLPLLLDGTTFVEPCAGSGDLIRHLEKYGHKPVAAYDIEPQGEFIDQCDALELTNEWMFEAECIITNPPWEWSILNPIITHFRKLRPTWLLLNADLMHNKRMSGHMQHCARVVSVGRVKWIPDSKHTGMENCAWYLFLPNETETIFTGRI